MIKLDSINNGWILYTPIYKQGEDSFHYIQTGFTENYYETLHTALAAIKNHYSSYWKEEQKKIKTRMQMGLK